MYSNYSCLTQIQEEKPSPTEGGTGFSPMLLGKDGQAPTSQAACDLGELQPLSVASCKLWGS